MIPCNNSEKFERKYGKLYYLRDFDYYPEELSWYNKRLSEEFMKLAFSGKFDIFKTKEEADEASYQIRKIRGLEPYAYNTSSAKENNNTNEISW